MSDYRVAWLRDRISKALGVQEHPETIEVLFKDHYEEFLEYLEEPILDVRQMEKCILYVYRTFYDKLVEREVLTIEKGKNFQQMSHITYRHRFPFQSAVPRIMTPPQPVTIDVSREKKGRKGKGKG